MSVKYQVFVSSTYDDLKAEREQVVKAVLEMGHIPVGMEMFSAADEQQWQIISRHIESSDYYVLIIAHRYGSMEGDKSFTEKEYDYAIQCGVPVLSFIIDEAVDWKPAKFEKDQQKRDALARFKEKVKGRYISYWASSSDLYGKVSISLNKQITAQPRVGWVRASEAAGPEILSELARLSKENSDLRSQLEFVRQSSGKDVTQSWKEFVDKVYDYCYAILIRKEISQKTMSPEVQKKMQQEAQADVERKLREVDKLVVKLEIEFRGSDQENNLQRAYKLLDKVDKGQSSLKEIMDFAKLIAATLRPSSQ